MRAKKFPTSIIIFIEQNPDREELNKGGAEKADSIWFLLSYPEEGDTLILCDQTFMTNM